MISFWSTEHRARDGVRIYSPQKLLRLVSNLPWWLDGKFGGWKERTQNLNIQPGPYFIHTFNNINCNCNCNTALIREKAEWIRNQLSQGLNISMLLTWVIFVMYARPRHGRHLSIMYSLLSENAGNDNGGIMLMDQHTTFSVILLHHLHRWIIQLWCNTHIIFGSASDDIFQVRLLLSIQSCGWEYRSPLNSGNFQLLLHLTFPV